MHASNPRPLVLALTSLLALSVVPALGCDKSEEPTVQPESVDSMLLFDGPRPLLLEVLGAMRTGDVAKARASIATPGQIETMCPGYSVPVTPYTETNLDAAIGKCQQVFTNVDDATFLDGLGGLSSIDSPSVDPIFGPNWAERCPDLKLYQYELVLEVVRESEGQAAGFEVSDVFEYRGKWGLLTIPRCRGAE